jgi:hypothetical protein
MDLIRDAIEWFATNTTSTAATLFPYAAIGLLGLYILWLVIGYLRVSQVGLSERPSRPVAALPPPTEAEAGVERPRGVPYCSFDALQYPLGARFCTQCERDLLLDCTNCGATLAAGDASCYRCGTPTGVAGASA